MPGRPPIADALIGCAARPYYDNYCVIKSTGTRRPKTRHRNWRGVCVCGSLYPHAMGKTGGLFQKQPPASLPEWSQTVDCGRKRAYSRVCVSRSRRVYHTHSRDVWRRLVNIGLGPEHASGIDQHQRQTVNSPSGAKQCPGTVFSSVH